MAIAFRIASTDAGAGAIDVQIPKPTGLADADVLIAVQNADANETLTAPAGWTACFAQAQTGTQTANAWYRVVASAAGEPATYVFGGPGTVARRGTIVCYSGVDNATPMDVAGSITPNTSSTTVHSVTITTVTANAVVVWAGAADSSTSNVTKPASCTNRDQATSLYRITMADLLKATAGATGSLDGTSGVASANIGMQIALRPAGAPAPKSYMPPSTTQRTHHVRR